MTYGSCRRAQIRPSVRFWGDWYPLMQEMP